MDYVFMKRYPPSRMELAREKLQEGLQWMVGRVSDRLPAIKSLGSANGKLSAFERRVAVIQENLRLEWNAVLRAPDNVECLTGGQKRGSGGEEIKAMKESEALDALFPQTAASKPAVKANAAPVQPVAPKPTPVKEQQPTPVKAQQVAPQGAKPVKAGLPPAKGLKGEASPSAATVQKAAVPRIEPAKRRPPLAQGQPQKPDAKTRPAVNSQQTVANAQNKPSAPVAPKPAAATPPEPFPVKPSVNLYKEEARFIDQYDYLVMRNRFLSRSIDHLASQYFKTASSGDGE